MSSLFWKGILAFLVVIIVAVGTVAILTGRVTENAFRRYALTRSGVWEGMTTQLAAYYNRNGSWDGIQAVLVRLPSSGPPMRARQGGPMGGLPRAMDFRIVDLEGRVVGSTMGPPQGAVSRAALDNSIPIMVDREVVGYLLPALRSLPTWPLDAAQIAFLTRVRRTLWIGGLAALGVALVLGGLLFRSITAPLRELTAASEAIAEGDLSVRADVRGRDEVAQLADAFNSMAGSLARIEDARRNQTADIAHELRTPLTVLQGTLEAMLDGVYAADQENLQAALIQTRTLSRLIEDLRILALADAGRLHLERDYLNLDTFLKEVVESYSLQARERQIALGFETPPPLPLVSADRDRLSQVLGNLLSNSLQYVPKGGHISVEVKQQEEGVIISVVDDGPGISADDLPHLFERFWRADRARRRATGGSGLGLSIARHIVEAHGGRLWADLTPGGGLTVSFFLPIE